MDTRPLYLNRIPTQSCWRAILALVMLLTSAIGCSSAVGEVMGQMEATSEAGGEDLRAAAAVYLQEAHRLETEAQRYADEAAAIKPLEDTKGFRRNALLRSAQHLREKAREMRQLYASQARKAETTTGMQPRP